MSTSQNTSAMREGESTPKLRRIESQSGEHFICREAGPLIATVYSRADAERIVQCCNAHDALVDVIQTIVRQCGERLTDASGNTALLDHAKYVLSKYGSAS